MNRRPARTPAPPLAQVDRLLRIDPGQPSVPDLRARIVAAQASPRSP